MAFQQRVHVGSFLQAGKLALLPTSFYDKWGRRKIDIARHILCRRLQIIIYGPIPLGKGVALLKSTCNVFPRLIGLDRKL